MTDKDRTPASEPESPITVKIEWLDKMAREPAFKSVRSLPWPTKLGYWIARNLAIVEREHKIIDERNMEMLKQFCELDDNGNLKRPGGPTGPLVWKDYGMYESERKKLLDEEVELTGAKLLNINLDDEEIKKAGPMPAHWEVLFPFMAEK